MKNLIYILIAGMLLVSCSKEDPEVNYLTSVERAKEGIIGTWERVGKDYTTTLTFIADSVFYHENNIENENIYDKGTWSIGTNNENNVYYLYSYVIGLTHTPYVISKLTDKELLLDSFAYTKLN